MINSYSDYLSYLEADRLALGRTASLKAWLFDDIWRFQRLLRKTEYLINCHPRSLRRRWFAFWLGRLGVKLGFSIPPNVFGPGLSIAHYGTIAVNDGAKVGANCRLHVCVVIGTKAGESRAAPTLGNNCYIGPGAKLFGPIHIGDNTAIGANSVVNRSFPEGNVTLAGVPARPVSQKTSAGLLVKAFNP
jgi:serine O-acetyltransferase